ncbi:DUF3325 domain-containing protein [Sphingobium limneticum]|uniref:DUF3325 domain-containing protein n=1 Tax=Sphingobium limneticum TaxID=1007511 RepID=UPI003D06276E
MTHIIAIALCIAGFASLCAAMVRHQPDFVGRKLDAETSRLLRHAGFSLLLAALAVDMIGLGAGYGAVAWCAHLTLGAGLVLFRLNRTIARQPVKAKPARKG